MDYKKRITAMKVATPLVILSVGKGLIEWIGNHIGLQIDDDKAINMTIAIYSAGVGIVNWFKNRSKGKK